MEPLQSSTAQSSVNLVKSELSQSYTKMCYSADCSKDLCRISNEAGAKADLAT